MTYTIEAHGLVKRFGARAALDGFDLSVPEGTVHGLLGPNGAGKTTAVRVLTTLLRPDAGAARVAGFDVVRDGDQVRRHIGLVGQHAALDEVLSGRANLEMFGRLSHLRPAAAARRAGELLDRFGLGDTGKKAVKNYSGGMRRRLDLAAGLILSPPVLFLDEPTTGLDPRGRAEVWSAVRDLVARGTTVLLTTQYLEEADQLAHRVSVVHEGRQVAEGTPEELKKTVGGDRVEIVVHDPADLPAAEALLGPSAQGDPDTRRVSAPASDRMATLTRVVQDLRDSGIAADDVAIRRPTLDEVFLHLTSSDRSHA
ncbi:ATP-binding cassette domain-containing protein [Herbidospora cretacea]|uniref:ATP-binding cassette domain-containing protein n=1 Tax=Herbidospora cretacea TaxID=28444 RepID=UPI000774889E|nr:ATP-binding cassette domain-containing protein [Herbidospora cretacea]